MIIHTKISDEELNDIREFCRQWRLWQEEYFADLGRDDIEIIGKIVTLLERILIEKLLDSQI
jgi:hypothetical protein